MASILFSHSYYYKFDHKQWKAATLYPPLGTIYAAAVMQTCNHKVNLFDSNFAASPDDLEGEILLQHYDYLVIYDDCFNWLTKMCLGRMRSAAYRMIELGKKYGLHIIVSSSDASDHYSEYLKAGADFVIIGEGEETLKDLIAKIENNEDNYRVINGIAFNLNGEIVKTSERARIEDLDTIPFPAWELVDIDRYRKLWDKSKMPFTLNIVSTRGCPYHCSWCAKPIYGYSYNSRSPENMVEEIEFLMKRFGVTHFWMCDDIFGLNADWLRHFSELILAKQLKISYLIQSRADILLRKEVIDLFSTSGLREVWIGAESGSQNILDAMNKGITTKQVIDVTHQFRKKGIRICFFLQLGYPGETKEDIVKTRKMIRSLMPDNIGVSVAYPLPGTVFYEQVKTELIAKSNWVDSDDLALMFRGTYHDNYYRKMHRLIHKEFRTFQSLQYLKNLLIAEVRPDLHKIRAIILLPYYFLSSLNYLIQTKVIEWKMS